MNLRVFLVPLVFFAVGVIVTLAAAEPGVRDAWLQFTVAITVVLSAAVGVFEVTRSRVGSARREALLTLSVPSALPPPRHDATAEAVLALSRVDPHFTPARVQAHVEALYRAMQVAHRTGDLAALHPWLSDGLFQRLSTQARLLGGIAGRELLEGHGLQSAVLVGAGLGEAYQAMTVRVTVAPRTAESSPHAAQTQTWRFLRRLSTTTREHGLFDGRCPNCGAPLRLTAAQRCDHCQAVLNSGEYDWVLVDQAPGALTLSPKPELLDPEGVRAKDTSLAPEELVDRAALAFWRWYEAGASGDTRRLARVATEHFVTTVGRGLAARPLAGVGLTVGGADLRLLRLREGRVEASVVLWWTTGTGDAQQTVLTLVRPLARAGTAPQAAGLASLRCEGCLAPMTDAESPTCEHCGHPFTDAWRLDAMEPFSSWSDAVRALRRETRAPGGWQTVPRHERLHALQLAVAVVRADGKVVGAERQLLERLAGEWGLFPDDLAAALAAPAGPASAAGLSLPRDFARELARQLIELVFVDGRADIPERKLVERLAGSLGVEAEARKLIASRVDALLKQHAS